MDEIVMAWVDLETTGLDANIDVPLEIGIALTDKWGNAHWEGSMLIWNDYEEDKNKIAHARNCDPIVGPMHEKSGLWHALDNREVSGYMSTYEADEWLCDILTDNGVRFGEVPMAGNSIGSLDRPFCLVHFPKFDKALSYRNIDMSTIKELLKMHNPILYERLKPIIGTKENAPHRVLGDIKAAIVEYNVYLEEFLMIGD